MRNKNIFARRILSVLLCVLMLVPLFSTIVMAADSNDIFPLSSSNTGTEAVLSTQIDYKNGIEFSIHRTTQYSGNRTYTVKFDISSTLSSSDTTVDRLSAKNGYFTVKESGWYLLELWGGKGAAGQEGVVVALVIPVNTDGGQGGHGGYVYAKMYLEAGQTVVYSIGTAGAESVVHEDNGGGENGGGTHGSSGSCTVGGGGGYSVFYVLEKGEFKEEYVTDEEVKLPEQIRTSRFVMIAGGGGGGGAGAGSLYANGEVPKAPNGGAAGFLRVGKSYSVALLGDEYSVPGYVFSGMNGVSSGQSNQFVGKGGSHVPGEDVSTALGLTSSTSQPNDWFGTYNPDAPYGEGGTGNYRGGGGGAGYTGGSGGIMGSFIAASDVGGGGGGSSFIAANVNGKPVEFLNLSSDEQKYLVGYNRSEDDEAIGGACHITFLSSEEESIDLSSLNNITVTGNISKYFDILNYSYSSYSNGSVRTDGTLTTKAENDGSTTFTATGLSIFPSSASGTGNNQVSTVTLFIRAKNGFIGGNAVPTVSHKFVTVDGEAVEQSTINISFADPTSSNSSNITNILADISTAHDYVNVPLDTEMITYSYTTSIDGKGYAISSLYIDSYASVRGSALPSPNYDFVDAMGEYAVYYDGSLYESSYAYSDAENRKKTYEIKYVVTLKNEAPALVTVGPAMPLENEIVGKAVISYVEASQAVLNKLEISTSKALTYNGGTYLFSTTVDQKSETLSMTFANENVNGEGIWVAPQTGWYLIQAWGGNGGNSGWVGRSGVNGNTSYVVGPNTPSGKTGTGTGGTGGYISGYVYLQKDEVVKYRSGNVGASSDINNGEITKNSDGSYKANTRLTKTNNTYIGHAGVGQGGNYTSVSIGPSDNLEYLLIAGGGGGSGESIVAVAQYITIFNTVGAIDGTEEPGETGGNGAKGTAEYSSFNMADIDKLFNGSPGLTGSGTAKASAIPSTSASPGDGGAAGANFRLTAMSTGYDPTGTGHTLSTNAKKYGDSISTNKPSDDKNGAVKITLVESDEMIATNDSITGISEKLAFSQYFNIDRISMTSSTSYSSTSTVTNDDGSKTVTYNSSTLGKVAEFTYKITQHNEGGEAYQTVEIYDCYYIPNAKIDSANKTATYSSTTTFNFYLTPKDGFLGGNDVPVLSYGKLGYGPDEGGGRVDEGVYLAQGDDYMHLVGDPLTDLANVNIEFDPLSYFTVADKTIDYGDSINVSELYSFTPPEYTGNDGWKDDFVQFDHPEEISYSPKATEIIPITVAISPIYKNPKAAINDATASIPVTLSTTVYVNHLITYELTNATVNGPDKILSGNELIFTVNPNLGYAPAKKADISVNITYVNGNGETVTESVDFDYSNNQVKVKGQYIKGEIKVKAKSNILTYVINVNYELYNEETGTIENKTYVYPSEKDAEGNYIGIAAGEEVNYSFLDDLSAEINTTLPMLEGYKYVWSYDTADGSRPDTMPSNNFWIQGGYVKKTYIITINYLYDDGTPVDGVESKQIELSHGDSFSIPSPVVPKYTARTPIVSGIATETQTIDVVYDKSSNTITVYYIMPNGAELTDGNGNPIRYHANNVSAGTYEITSPEVIGHSPDRSVLSVTSDGLNGITEYVYYSPNSYTVNFEYRYEDTDYPELDGADFSTATSNLGYDSKTVEYNNLYSYNSSIDSYDGLPAPQIAGYTFKGWFTDTTFETQVVEGDTFNHTEDITLYAKWAPASFTLVVEFQFLYDSAFLPTGYGSVDEVNAALPTITLKDIAYGSAYEVDITSFVGYTSYKNYALNNQMPVIEKLTGTMPAQNTKITICYEINTYEISFRDNTGANYLTYVEYINAEGEKDTSVASTQDLASDFKVESWQTVFVKHGVSPEFTKSEPTHATNERYTYSFKNWRYDLDGEDYMQGETLPTATESTSYYAVYTANENIVSVYENAKYSYFFKISDAVKYAESKMTSSVSPKITFRRNEGNPKVLCLDGDTMIFGSVYNETTICKITISLNGFALNTTDGSPLIENTGYIDLTVTGTGSLSASAELDATTVKVQGKEFRLDGAISISADSENGNATAISFAAVGSYDYLYLMANNISITANAPNGTAIGINMADKSYTNYISTSSSYTPTVMTVTGKTAYGIYVDTSSNVTWYGNMSVTGDNGAYGIFESNSISFYGSVNVTAKSDNAEAIGIKTVSATLSGNASVSVTSTEGMGYGIIVTGSQLTPTKAVISVEAKDAVGILAESGGKVYFSTSSSAINITLNGSNSATGIHISSGATLTDSVTATVTISSEGDGTAYGIINKGTIASLNMTLNLTAQSDAFGIYHDGGTVTVGSVTALTVDAVSSNGTGFGIYVKSGSFGSESAYLKKGVISGSDYGIYCEDGTIYVSGNDLYFKGTDKDSSLYGIGVIIDTDYDVIKGNSPYEEYYRLAVPHSITYYTYGGTVIENVEKIYVYETVSIPSDPANNGYAFAGWYEDCTDGVYTGKTSIPSIMTDEDLVFHADWTLLKYNYYLDTTFKDITVKFYKNTSADDTELFGEVTLTKDSPILVPPVTDPTYRSGTYLYIFSGWYTDRTISNAVYYDLTGDISELDTDSDNVVELYAGWRRANNIYNADGSFNKIGIDSNISKSDASYVEGKYQSSSMYYQYFVIPKDGTYTINTANVMPDGASSSSSYQKRFYIYTFKDAATTPTAYNSSYYSTNYSNTVSYTARNIGTFKAGDVIAIGYYRRSSSYPSYVYAYVSSTTTDLFEETAPAYSTYVDEPYVYDVTMGEVSLPLYEATEPGQRFGGWRPDGSEESLIKISPETVGKYGWSPENELLLYSFFEFKTWSSYSSLGRDFTRLTGQEKLTIRNDSSISVRFTTSDECGGTISFAFDKGLNAGTILTLVDNSGSETYYYSYTVENDGLTEISSQEFIICGGNTPFSGISTSVNLQICYQNSPTDVTEESVSIFAGGATPEESISYYVIDASPTVEEKEDISLKYTERGSVDITVPALDGKGYNDSDRLFVVIRWGQLSMSAGAAFTYNGNVAALYTDEFAKLELGLTVADVKELDSQITVEFHLGNMMQNEFENIPFEFTVYVSPDTFYGSTVFASDIYPVSKLTQNITLKETPALTMEDTSTREVELGQRLVIEGIILQSSEASTTEPTPSVYVCMLTDNGPAVVDQCFTLINPDYGISVGEDGFLYDASGAGIITDGILTLVISENATVGIYQLKIVHEDKCIIVPFKVTEPPVAGQTTN